MTRAEFHGRAWAACKGLGAEAGVDGVGTATAIEADKKPRPRWIDRGFQPKDDRRDDHLSRHNTTAPTLPCLGDEVIQNHSGASG